MTTYPYWDAKYQRQNLALQTRVVDHTFGTLFATGLGLRL